MAAQPGLLKDMTNHPVAVRAPGKINLSLRSGLPDANGYHRLATVFQAVDLWETVTVQDAEEITVQMHGAGARRVPVDATNLVVRAAHALLHHMHSEYGEVIERGASIQVEKQVPVAGGMGGGSADAAAALLALTVLWDLPFTRDDLSRIGASLGADVPFALLGHTALGVGYGDVLSPVLAEGDWNWLLIEPGGGLSTPEIFHRFDAMVEAGTLTVDPEPQPDAVLLQALRVGDAHQLGRCLVNDLQAPAFAAAPQLRDLVTAALKAGALGAVVSGSGPTIAVLGESMEHLEQLDSTIRARHPVQRTHVVKAAVPGAHLL